MHFHILKPVCECPCFLMSWALFCFWETLRANSQSGHILLPWAFLFVSLTCQNLAWILHMQHLAQGICSGTFPEWWTNWPSDKWVAVRHGLNQGTKLISADYFHLSFQVVKWTNFDSLTKGGVSSQVLLHYTKGLISKRTLPVSMWRSTESRIPLMGQIFLWLLIFGGSHLVSKGN